MIRHIMCPNCHLARFNVIDLIEEKTTHIDTVHHIRPNSPTKASRDEIKTARQVICDNCKTILFEIRAS